MSPSDRPSPSNDGGRGPRSPSGRPAGGGRSGGGSKGSNPRSGSSKGSGPRGDSGSGRPGQGGGRSGSRPGEGSRSGGGGRPQAGRGGAPGSGPRRSVNDRGGRPDDGSVDERGRDVAGPKQWGSLGRRGAGRLGESRIDSRNAAGATARDDRPDPGNRPVRWERVDTEEVREEASGAVGRGRKPSPRAGAGGRSRRPAGDSVEKAIEPKERRGRAARPASKGSGGADARDALVSALGAARGSKANERLRDAAHAFERERYEEARKLLRPLAEVAPQVAAVRELLGLTYYRLGKWSDALRELGSFREMTRSTEQHPVLADCNRALKRHSEVEALWDELRDVSPSPDLVAEGRIVMAGSLADRNRMREAISLLEKSQRSVKRPQVHHLRQAYVLADLYERGGDVTRARELFRWIVVHEAGFADAAERAGALT